MINKVGICLLVVITLMVLYRLSGLAGCSNDKFYDKLNEAQDFGGFMRSDQTVLDTEYFDYMKSQTKPWNAKLSNNNCKITMYDIDYNIDVDDYKLVKTDEPISMYFNYNKKKMVTFFNHRHVDAGKYFDYMKALMNSEEITLPDLKYTPFVSEIMLIPYGVKMSKKFISPRTIIPRDQKHVTHIHSIMSNDTITEIKKELPNIKTKSIIAYFVLNYILNNVRKHKKKGSLRVLFTVGFSNKDRKYKNIGNMIGGIVIDIPYHLKGIELMKYVNTSLKKEMSQSVHSLNFQVSLPAISDAPKFTRNNIDMIFSLSPIFKCKRVPHRVDVLVPFILQPLYSLVLSCNDQHFIYLASMSSWIEGQKK
tara:strand:- start:34 stop:1128 length:1095 start_codon:yes stop_codon:yes gene_type:complete